MQVSQSAEANIPPPRSPLPLTMADCCSVSLLRLSATQTHTPPAHASVHAKVNREQMEQFRSILQTLWLTFSKAGVMLLSFNDI